MFRSALASLAVIVAFATHESEHIPHVIAWPLLVRVSGIHDRPTAFRAFSRGADLILQTALVTNPANPLYPPLPRLEPLATRDTLSATAPMSYPLDLRRGTVTFYTVGPESLRVVVGKNPYGMVRQVSAVGRRLTVRLVEDRIVIDAR